MHNSNWTSNGNHDGGVSYGAGFCISWQRGPIGEEGRNGACLMEVLEACCHQLQYFQDSKFACEENALALMHLEYAIAQLKARSNRRALAGTLGTAKGN